MRLIKRDGGSGSDRGLIHPVQHNDLIHRPNYQQFQTQPGDHKDNFFQKGFDNINKWKRDIFDRDDKRRFQTQPNMQPPQQNEDIPFNFDENKHSKYY